ncbi:hypothetical protein AB0E75_03735 [Streptomyces griseoviridis]|uniref:Uncharacterized protein n=3 Tax=Streptomyces TaxID=1883 RepID=A0A918G911_STRGD|nr:MULTISPECIES: hypothetical protein [Streptomyces]MDP9683575.1 hypothetical protein [Streptomyces griseoviridis]GGS23930.1 hypothetical protein GCM10010238_10030 [Streptomyces niveoruber]GGS93919.1 hypothetical protein GCM10010240_29210 [Streptomyces griseoviridis]GGU21436.1 hypothetical protein GCM10010259_09620 [Streptomyces daghestanicus]GHI31482.1 hypothetical protein Sdagh_32120 [Streptomyces daghestanicus]
MPASPTPGRPLPAPPAAVPMRDLLAACAAAAAISTPPRAPEPEPRAAAPEHREAA